MKKLGSSYFLISSEYIVPQSCSSSELSFTKEKSLGLEQVCYALEFNTNKAGIINLLKS